MNEEDPFAKAKVKGGTAEIEVAEPGELPVLPPGRAAPALEQYVAEAVEAARVVAEQGFKRLGDMREPENQKELNERKRDMALRLELAEKYARWRWRGYVDGEVTSL
jgi:hypothetical protein